MSRKIIINGVVNFEPEKKRISGEKGIHTLSASAALCFELLIDNIGNLVTHDQFYEYAWRRFGMEPTSTSLYQNISTLRKSLSKAGIEQDIIRTMPRRGILLSPLTEIDRTGPEKIIEEDGNDEKKTDINQDENSELINEKKSVEMNSSISLLPLGPKNRALTRRHNRMSWLLASASGIVIGVFAYFLQTHTRYDPLFTSKPVFYKGCTIFSNKDNDFEGDKMLRLLDDLSLVCENDRYAYVTSYRFSERTSILFCRNQLGDKKAPGCHSVYYIKNMLK